MGGDATRLFRSNPLDGASWEDDGTIVAALDWGNPLQVFRPGASALAPLTRLDSQAGEGAHLWPQILPGKRHVLFTVWSGAPTWNEETLAVADVETGAHTVILRGGTSGYYTSSGHLVFWRGNALMAVPFDLDTMRVTGSPVRVVPDVRLDIAQGKAQFDVSRTGTLAYVKGGADAFAETLIVDRSGRQVARLDESEPVGEPMFSPDGKRVALNLFKGATFGVGVFDLERRVLTRLALTGDSTFPTWTSGGDRLTYLSNMSGGGYSYYSVAFDGSNKPESLFPGDQGYARRPVWSPDGRFLMYARPGEKTSNDIWIQAPG
jgi:hypothetical protein